MEVLQVFVNIIERFFKSEAPVKTNFRILTNYMYLTDSYVNTQSSLAI